MVAHSIDVVLGQLGFGHLDLVNPANAGASANLTGQQGRE